MNAFPWHSLVVFALLAGLYAVCVGWNRHVNTAKKPPTPIYRTVSKASSIPLETSLFPSELPSQAPPSDTNLIGGQNFIDVLSEKMEPWAHVPPIGHLRQRFESDILESMPAGSFDPKTVFMLGSHGHYHNPDVDAAWCGWRLSLVSLSLHGQLA
mgnify:CR=1 FL=1